MAAAVDPRTTVVVITHNRRGELLHTLRQLTALPERPPIVVVDNGSEDGTAETLAAFTTDHPQVRVVAPGGNLGALGRNLAMREVRTPYVAFCDDDSWWAPGSLRRCADILDAVPALAAVTGRILVEPGGREDPIVAELRESPIERPSWLPGPALVSILAAASVVRADAFREAGGFSARLWLGGEEELLAADLATCGWWLCYADDVTVHHAPSAARDAHARRRHGIRNTLWFTWLRRPWGAALGRTVYLARTVPRDRASVGGFLEAAGGLPWVLRERKPLPDHVEQRLRQVEAAQRSSVARRYVS